MKYVVWIMLVLNSYLGLRYFLNVIGVLRTTKYSKTATLVFAILFLGMGACGFYVYAFTNNLNMALLVSIGPWALALLFLLYNMLTSDYK